MSVDQCEEAKEENQKWKYSNQRTSESWRKVEATAIWDSLRRRACARNVSFRIFLRWIIHTINSVDKTKLPCNTPTDAAPQFLYKLTPFTCLSEMKPAKDRVESWQRRCNDSTCSFWLACLLSCPIRPAFLQYISWRVSVESVINKRKSSCQFAWRNGYKYGSDVGLEGLSCQSKIIPINIRISPLLSREKVKHARFPKSP